MAINLEKELKDWQKAYRELKAQIKELNTLKGLSQHIANQVGMPYVWEDVVNRLRRGDSLAFTLNDDLKAGD